MLTKEELRTATKEQMVLELTIAWSELITAYLKKEPIYAKIHRLQDILSVLLERCK